MDTATLESKRGFTLVELSIVLVVIGLITGGIIGGSELIRAAEIRSIITQVEQYQAALISFTDRYRYLLGDFPYASKYWQDCAPDPTHCNGNGNGKIEGTTNMSGTWVVGNKEQYRAWQQLSDSKLITGSYSGEIPVPITASEPGVHSPAAKRTGVTYMLGYMDSVNFNEGFWGSHSYGNKIFFGLGRGRAVAFTPTEAWQIDSKIDDGQPDQGQIQGDGKTRPCFTASTFPEAEYNFAVDDRHCSLHAKIE